jgi:hypothetical protein
VLKPSRSHAPVVERNALAGSLPRLKTEEGALTVAGQWRNFTAFPSILTIEVVTLIARSWTARMS